MDKVEDRVSRHIQTLDTFSICRGDVPIPDSGWKVQKNKILLKILLTYRYHPLTKDQLIGWSWHDLDPHAVSHDQKWFCRKCPAESIKPDTEASTQD